MGEAMNEAANEATDEAANEAMGEAAVEAMSARMDAAGPGGALVAGDHARAVGGDGVTDEAEAGSASLDDRIAALEAQLRQAHEALDASERQRSIDLALVEADAVDVETARLLTEIAVTQMDEPDVALAVSELKGRKPFLFRRERPLGVSAMGVGGAVGRGGLAGELEDAAEAALETGDRASLLAYLRMRRSGGV